MELNNKRIVALIDMDCFYCQVEEKLNPQLKGKPIAVVQYNEWKGGGIIAVNYLARAKGVTRSMRGDEAREKCPDIELPKVPCVRGKADISKYRDAGKDVALVLQRFTPLLERASIDEAYLDITEVVKNRIDAYRPPHSITATNLPNTFVLGYPNVENFITDVYKDKDSNLEDELFNFDQGHSLQLLVGAVVVSEIRAAVFEVTGYQCSAGIAHNKIMSKLVCGMNKPNKQTLLPLNAVQTVFESLPVNKIKSLGGKFGIMVCDILNITKMQELIQFSEKDLQKHFDEKNGSWLYNIARGIDNEPVTPRFTSKSIGCCKKFAGKSAIVNLASLTHWLGELGDEIEDRLKIDSLENNRYPTQVVVSFTKQLANGKDVSCSRSFNFKKGNDLCGKFLAENSLLLIKKDSKPFSSVESQGYEDSELIVLSHPIKYLGISVGKFEELNHSKKGKNIVHFFGQNALPPTQTIDNNSKIESENKINDDNSQENDLVERLPQNQLASSSKHCTLPHDATERESSTNHTTILKTQESFFMKYFRNNSDDKCGDLPNLYMESNNIENLDAHDEILELQQETVENRSKNSPQNKESSCILNEACDSDDSECTIDLEINRSKQLIGSEELSPSISTRPSVPRNFFTFSKQADISEEITEENSPINVIFCHECNKNIPDIEYSMHSDYHLALSLRQEERKSIQRPIVQPAVTQQEQCKKKKKNAQTDVNKSANIMTFFGKSVNNSVDDGFPTEQCFECGKMVKLTDFSEHLDYHIAKKMSIEINKPLITYSNENGTGKRKRISKEDVTKKNKKENKPNISSFFTEK